MLVLMGARPLFQICLGIGVVKIPMIRHFHPSWAWFYATLLLFIMLGATDAFAHGVAEGDQGYVQEVSGVQFLPFM
jgi:hypothetical protein